MRRWVAVVIGLLASGCSLQRDGLFTEDGSSSTEVTGTGGSTSSLGTGGAAQGTGGSTMVGSTSSTSTGGGAPPMGCSAGTVCMPNPGGGTFVGDPGCASGWTAGPTLFTGEAQPGCTNDTCSCSAPMGGSCMQDGEVERYFQPDCSSPKMGDSQPNAQPLTCYSRDLSSNAQAGGYRYLDPTVLSGTCNPQGSVSTNPPTTRETCTPTVAPTDVCEGGGVCVPTSANAICVSLAGDVACPSGYPSREVAYEAVNDTRQCTCSCGGETGASCSATVQLFETASCTPTTPLATFTSGAGCFAAFPNHISHDSFAVTAAAYTAGTCASTVEETGSIAFNQAVTICCP